MRKYLLFTLLISLQAFSQDPTVGLLKNEPASGVEYVLFSPEKFETTYLIDRCGEVVNEWQFSESPGLTCYLLENGNILQAGRDSLEIRDWDDNLIWSYGIKADGYLRHHDVEPLPNGNILCLVNEKFTTAEIIDQGKDPSLLGTLFKVDMILEIEPVGTNEMNIVWQWKFSDHLIQDYDNTKPNFGVVGDHPELLDLNYINGHLSDYSHCNGIDYNAELDQILFSARHTNEIYIIDHSTTTTEAASNTGGVYGSGGDLLWRWGNPMIYDQGDLSNQKLRLQHDSKWIESGADEGLISVFNNDGDGVLNQSFVHIVDPQDSLGFYKFESNNFLPVDFSYSWSGDILGTTVNEATKSGVQTLSNGNMFITETSLGRVSEVDRNGNVVWSYLNPKETTSTYDQFDVVDPNNSSNTFFRGENYAQDFPGFIGKDLSGNGLIENVNSISESCVLDVPNQMLVQDLRLISNISNGNLDFNREINGNVNIYDLNGSHVYNNKLFGSTNVHINLKNGMYICVVTEGESQSRFKFIARKN